MTSWSPLGLVSLLGTSIVLVGVVTKEVVAGTCSRKIGSVIPKLASTRSLLNTWGYWAPAMAISPTTVPPELGPRGEDNEIVKVVCLKLNPTVSL